MEDRFHKRQKIYRIFYTFPLRLEMIHRFFPQSAERFYSFFLIQNYQ